MLLHHQYDQWETNAILERSYKMYDVRYLQGFLKTFVLLAQKMSCYSLCYLCNIVLLKRNVDSVKSVVFHEEWERIVFILWLFQFQLIDP